MFKSFWRLFIIQKRVKDNTVNSEENDSEEESKGENSAESEDESSERDSRSPSPPPKRNKSKRKPQKGSQHKNRGKVLENIRNHSMISSTAFILNLNSFCSIIHYYLLYFSFKYTNLWRSKKYE